MRKPLYLALVATLFINHANAAQKIDGRVSLNSNFMFGQMSAENTATSSSPSQNISASARFNPNFTYVRFSARNNNGQYFTCLVKEKSELYSYALSVYRSLGNGSYLFVRSNPQNIDDAIGDGIECTSIYHSKVSSYLK